MSDLQRDPLHDLLAEAVSDVEPRHTLDDIRSRTRPGHRRWPYAAGGAVLGIAATIAVFTVVDGDQVRDVRDADPAGSPATSTSSEPTPSPAPSATEPPGGTATSGPGRAMAVYYIGETPRGPRLFREFRQVPNAGDPLDLALQQLEQLPQDPDYRTAWTEGSMVAASFDGAGTDGLLEVTLADSSFATRRQGMSADEARLAVEQVVYTLQAVVGERAPVQFLVDGNPISEVRGVPTSEPIVEGPVLETLALASLSDPSERLLVPRDRPLKVRGVGNSFEGTLLWRLTRVGTDEEVASGSFQAGWGEERLFPFEDEVDVSTLEPGDYVLSVATDDPSGGAEGFGPDVDDRTITIVE